MNSSPVDKSATGATDRRCRFCNTRLQNVFVDLGLSPLCQTQIAPEQLDSGEAFYPMCVMICHSCYLVQLGEYVKPDIIFSEQYPYFSSYSDSWVAHARKYVEHMREIYGIGSDSFVVEIASNDGYLLQHFQSAGVACLGVEPSRGVAEAARGKGIDTLTRFFGRTTAVEITEAREKADLVVGNNVLAHVPDLNDFVAGLEALVKDDGIITMEFPYLIRLMDENQFDTIYHEHFSYFSFSVVDRVFAHHGLCIFDVEQLRSHGGSLRIYACKQGASRRPISERARELLDREAGMGVSTIEFYAGFEQRVRKTKRALLEFLISAKEEGKVVVGYGAPGKGNTLLNYCGIRTDFLDYTVDRNPHKQNTFTPGTRIPILDPSVIDETKPDYILILPWNLRDEIMGALSHVRNWGCRFVVPIPEVRIVD